MRTPPTLTRIAANGTTLAAWDWDGPGKTLVFVHANGFHARCWDAIIELLPDYRCVALDLRGHGRSDKPAPPDDWRAFGEDVAAVARHFGLRDALGIGHSVGGHAMALAAALEPAIFTRLLLIDPTIMPIGRYHGARTGEHFVAQRRNEWASVEAMVARFADRPPFSKWEPRVLRDYCEYGLLPAPDGEGYVLACPPAFEATIYQVSTAVASNIYPEVEGLTQPTLIVRAGGAERGTGPNFSASPTAPDLIAHVQRGRDVLDRDYTHFMPMESPAHTAAYVRAALDDTATA